MVTNLRDVINPKTTRVIEVFPAVSMRSYETGLYRPSMDGNFVYWMYRLADINKMEGLDCEVTIHLPYQIDEDELNNVKAFAYNVCTATIVKNELYGENIAETRKNFAEANITVGHHPIHHRRHVCVISDFAEIEGCDIYNFNASKKSEDETRYDDILPKQIERSENGFVFVHNSSQKKYMPKAIVDRRVVNLEVFDDLLDMSPYYVKPEIKAFLRNEHNETLFFPFRVTDPSYGFEALLQELDLTGDIQVKDMDDIVHTFRHIVITDPNDAYKESGVVNSSVSVVKMDKNDLLFTLKHLHVTELKILMNVDPCHEFHQLGVEASILCGDRLLVKGPSCYSVDHGILAEMYSYR